MNYRSSKTYGHEVGFSCAFRQWRAESHCRFVHGYALSFHFEFETARVDHRKWVVDFGGLKSLKEQLSEQFDHKLLVAYDDPMIETFALLNTQGAAQVRYVNATGCEAFAETAFWMAEAWLVDNGYAPRVKMHHVTVREHAANGATFTGERRE